MDDRTTRIEWIDAAKGIGIILVLIGHRDSTWGVYSYIYSFHMALFFFLSGITVNIHKHRGFISFIKNRMKRLLVPYLIFSMFSLPIVYLQAKYPEYTVHSLLPYLDVNGSNYIKIIFFSLIGVNGDVLWNIALWFLPCLFVAEILLYLIIRLVEFLSDRNSFFIIKSSIGICLILFSLIGYSINSRLIFNVDLALIAVVFLGLGYIFGLMKVKIVNNSNSLLLMIAALFVSVFVGYYVNTNFHLGLDIAIKNNIIKYVASYIAAIAGIVLVILMSHLIKNKIIIYLGNNSLFIMLTHLPIFWFMQSLEKYMGLELYNNTPPGILKSLIYTFICILISWPCIEIVNRYFPFLIGRKMKKNRKSRTVTVGQ